LSSQDRNAPKNLAKNISQQKDSFSTKNAPNWLKIWWCVPQDAGNKKQNLKKNCEGFAANVRFNMWNFAFKNSNEVKVAFSKTFPTVFLKIQQCVDNDLKIATKNFRDNFRCQSCENSKTRKMCWNEYVFKEQYFSEVWQRKRFWQYFFVFFRSLATVYENFEKTVGIVCEKTRREVSVFHRETFVLILRIFAVKPLQKFYKICFLFPGSWGTHHQIMSQFKAFFVENDIFLQKKVFCEIFRRIPTLTGKM